MLEILKNKPIPNRFTGRSKLVSKMKEMAVGDCIELKGLTNTASIYYAAKAAGITVTLRRLGGDDKSRHIGVWRVENDD